MDLTDIVIAALTKHKTQIDQTGRKWPDRPVELKLSFHPAMGKLDVMILTIDHLPPYRIVETRSTQPLT